MKSSIKKVSLMLVVLMVLTISFGCTPKNSTTEEKIYTDLGFLSKINTDDGKNDIIITTNEKDLTLKVTDKNLLENLTVNEYYMVAFNQDNIVKSIEAKPFIKTLVENYEKSDKELESINIKATDKVNVDDLTLLDSYIVDFDNDGADETIALYTEAGKDEKGNIMWDDGQNWLLVVQDTDKDYVLFKDYVQLGNIKLYVYTSDDNFHISTVQTGTANLKLTEYKFDKESNTFNSTTMFKTNGNINMLHFPSEY